MLAIQVDFGFRISDFGFEEPAADGLSSYE